MIDAAENGIYLDPDLAQFYDLAAPVRADFDFCRKMAATVASVLDLGCGTGELAVSLAEGRDICGIDPAAAMLEIARSRAGSEKVDFTLADARWVRLPRKFDLVVLTGHSFQVFLTDADQMAVLATIAAHLHPGGRFVFDSRNPHVRNRRLVKVTPINANCSILIRDALRRGTDRSMRRPAGF